MEISRTQLGYSDFDFDFIAHPVTGDLVKKTDREAVRQSVRNLILLHFGELGFNPLKGSGIHYSLFEHNTPNNRHLIMRRIDEVIKNFEPRAVLESIRLDDQKDPNGIHLDVIFWIKNIQDPILLTVFLERIR